MWTNGLADCEMCTGIEFLTEQDIYWPGFEFILERCLKRLTFEACCIRLLSPFLLSLPLFVYACALVLAFAIITTSLVLPCRFVAFCKLFELHFMFICRLIRIQVCEESALPLSLWVRRSILYSLLFLVPCPLGDMRLIEKCCMTSVWYLNWNECKQILYCRRDCPRARVIVYGKTMNKPFHF